MPHSYVAKPVADPPADQRPEGWPAIWPYPGPHPPGFPPGQEPGGGGDIEKIAHSAVFTVTQSGQGLGVVHLDARIQQDSSFLLHDVDLLPDPPSGIFAYATTYWLNTGYNHGPSFEYEDFGGDFVITRPGDGVVQITATNLSNGSAYIFYIYRAILGGIDCTITLNVKRYENGELVETFNSERVYTAEHGFENEAFLEFSIQDEKLIAYESF